MTKLYKEVEGQGRPLVVLHGWGMNSRVWQPIRAHLATLAEVTYIDLPGHGQNTHLALGSLAHVVQQLQSYIPDNALIMGWSLGGLIAQALAQHLPERIKGVIMVASTPKFMNDSHWVHGLDASTLDLFSRNLHIDYLGTIKRFFALQFLNTHMDMKAVNGLRDFILEQPATADALSDGLTILRTSDFSAQPLHQPTQWILGHLDKLIPASVAQVLPAMGYESVTILPHAAHVPFITHVDEFMHTVRTFCHAQ